MNRAGPARSQKHAFFSCLVLAALVGLTLAGCFRSEEPVQIEADELHIGWGVYFTRALVVALPADGQELELKHEAIPTFLSIKGEMIGMQAMQMPFPLGEGVSIEGIEVGDKVEFTFEVDWDPGYYIVSISALPDETELDFSKKDPPTVYNTGP